MKLEFCIYWVSTLPMNYSPSFPSVQILNTSVVAFFSLSRLLVSRVPKDFRLGQSRRRSWVVDECSELGSGFRSCANHTGRMAQTFFSVKMGSNMFFYIIESWSTWNKSQWYSGAFLRSVLISIHMILVLILGGCRNYTNRLPGCSKALRVAWSLEIKDWEPAASDCLQHPAG